MSRSGGLRVFGMVLVLGLSASGAGAEEQLVVGAGPSTRIVALFFELFFEVSPPIPCWGIASDAWPPAWMIT